VLDTASRWRMTWRDDFEAAILRVPRHNIDMRLGRMKASLPIVLGHTVAANAARPILGLLASNMDILEQADLGAGEIAITELVTSALLSELKMPDGEMTQVQAAHFRRVAAAIDTRLAEPDLSLADIAAQEGMSVRYLQRLFERRHESFSDYLRQQRLERSRADLLDPNHAQESVAQIALRWGFRNPAHFSRSFSAEFGLSPRALRTAGQDKVLPYPRRGHPGHQSRLPARPHSTLDHLRSAEDDMPKPALERLAGEPVLLPANSDTVHWGYISRTIPPVLRVNPGETVRIETLTQHGGDDYERMVAGDPGAESVFEWTSETKAVNRRGAGPMNASVFGRGAGEGFGVHICTGPVYVRGAKPGDILEVEILDIHPRPCANPAFPGKAFGSNAAAWWGYQYQDPLDGGQKREVITIYEIDLADPSVARALYSYRWTPQTDPFGVVHETIDYPGLVVDHDRVELRDSLEGIIVPARPHFGFIGVAPREAELIDSIPPGYFGGNFDNWRSGKGAKVYLPVAVEGALLSIGDAHFAQGDGEVNGTGLECSMTGDIRLTLHKPGETCAPHLRGLSAPLIETETHWVIQSFSYENYLRDLGRDAQSEVYKRSTVDQALRNTFRQTRRFLMDTYALSEDDAVSLMSVAVDFSVTQVADGNLGVHATIRKDLFAR
jgi:acetamidase/formamidase/AraC-like DNA-binding protein